MNTDEKIEVMQASLNGDQIQSKDKRSNDWYDLREKEIIWSWDSDDYRIKPQPKTRTMNSEEFRALMSGDNARFVKCFHASSIHQFPAFYVEDKEIHFETMEDFVKISECEYSHDLKTWKKFETTE